MQFTCHMHTCTLMEGNWTKIALKGKMDYIVLEGNKTKMAPINKWTKMLQTELKSIKFARITNSCDCLI